MEIINSDNSPVTQEVEYNFALILEEVFPEEPIDPSDISDKNWDVFEFIKVAITEQTPVQALEIAERVDEFGNVVVYKCLTAMWKAGLIRRFLRIRYRFNRAQPKKAQLWYLINNVKDYVLPEKPVRPKSKRPRGFKTIPDEVVAQIRGYGPEVTTEWIARKHEISIWWTEKLRYYEVRPYILPKK